MSYIGSIISDIHFGASDPDQLMESLDKYYLKKLKKLPKLDFIIIAGDLYDTTLPLQNLYVKYSFIFMNKLMKIAKKKNAKVRLIQGTLFHDGKNQLDNFKFFEFDDEYDFKIIKNVEEEMLFPDFPVLYIPEEYMKDKYEYYEEYLKKKNYYKMIFGHGMFKEVAFGKDNEIVKQEAPIFNVEDLNDICSGPIVFGHIHIRTNIYNKVFYCGSFERWRFGEELSKGSLLTIMNPNDDKYIIGVLENKNARKYDTLDISELTKKYNENEIIKYIENYYDRENIYKLRLKCDCSMGDLTCIKILKEYYSRNQYIKIDVINEEIVQINLEKEESDIVDEYDYLFKDNYTTEDKLSKFIEHKFSYNIDSKRLSELLIQDNISKIMNDINSISE